MRVLATSRGVVTAAENPPANAPHSDDCHGLTGDCCISDHFSCQQYRWHVGIHQSIDHVLFQATEAHITDRQTDSTKTGRRQNRKVWQHRRTNEKLYNVVVAVKNMTRINYPCGPFKKIHVAFLWLTSNVLTQWYHGNKNAFNNCLKLSATSSIFRTSLGPDSRAGNRKITTAVGTEPIAQVTWQNVDAGGKQRQMLVSSGPLSTMKDLQPN